MATCSRCGQPITFRYVEGRCVPLHLHGGCTDHTSSASDYSGRSRSDESCCFLTECPECGEEVFFIRYNGGSVWIDPPLGPPWYKHPCMESTSDSTKAERASLLPKYKLEGIESPDEYILGVVKECEVSPDKSQTITEFHTEEGEKYVFSVKFNAGFLTGKLVVFDSLNKELFPFWDRNYVFRVLRILRRKKAKKKKKKEHIKCPECGVDLNPENLEKHLKKMHPESRNHE